MKILAFDIATRTGIAIGEPNGVPLAWSENLAKGLGKSPSLDERLSRLLTLTYRLIKEHQPDLVVAEDKIGGQKVNAQLLQMTGCVRGCVANQGLPPVWLIAVSTARKHFLGKAYTAKDFPHLKVKEVRGEIKSMVRQNCRLLGWGDLDEDAADACAVLDYALAMRTNHQARVAGGLV